MTYLIDFRTADVGGAVSAGLVVPGAGLGTLQDLRAEAQVTFLIHGFNVSRQSGTQTLTSLANALPAGGSYAGVLWPGDHFIGPISYPFEGTNADDTGAALAQFIAAALRRGVRLSFISHSLGARVVLETVKRLNQTDYPIGQVCLEAAAIDDFSVAEPAKYLSTMAKADRVAVLASRSDSVLLLAYPAGDLLQSFLFFRTDEPGLALGFHGPRPFLTEAVPRQVYHEQIPVGRFVGHGDYFPDGAPTPKEQSAVAFATDVINGIPQPRYA